VLKASQTGGAQARHMFLGLGVGAALVFAVLVLVPLAFSSIDMPAGSSLASW